MLNKQARKTIAALTIAIAGALLVFSRPHFGGLQFANPVTAYQWGYDTGQLAAVAAGIIFVATIVVCAVMLLRQASRKP